MDAIEFFSALYDPVRRSAGNIELRLLKNGEPTCIGRKFTMNPRVIEDTLSRWGQPSQPVGVYYGVALRNPEATTGKKTDISVIPALWTDIDVVKMGWDEKLTIGALKSMELRPSAIVHSGNGLHAYWALSDPVYLPTDDTRTRIIMRVEDAMRKLAGLVGGDNTFDITRVLRVPGTFNTKGDKPKPVKVLVAGWEEYSLEQLESLAGTTDTLLDNGVWLSKEQVKERARALKEKNRMLGLATDAAGLSARRLSIDQIWQLARYGGGERGAAWLGLDEAMLRAIAVTYAEYSFKPDSWILDTVLLNVRRIKQRDAPNEIWNEELERRKAQDKLDRFKDKWQAKVAENDSGKTRGKRVRSGTRGQQWAASKTEKRTAGRRRKQTTAPARLHGRVVC